MAKRGSNKSRPKPYTGDIRKVKSDMQQLAGGLGSVVPTIIIANEEIAKKK